MLAAPATHLAAMASALAAAVPAPALAALPPRAAVALALTKDPALEWQVLGFEISYKYSGQSYLK